MFGKTKSLFFIVTSLLFIASCDSIREDLPRCELWLEFTFDYNMEYADAFSPQMYLFLIVMTNWFSLKERNLLN